MRTVVSTVADWNYYLAAAAWVLLPVLLKTMGGLSTGVRRSLTGSKKKKSLPFPVASGGFVWVSFRIFGLFAAFVSEVVLRLCNL